MHVLSPKESGSFVAKHSKHVTLQKPGIVALAKEISEELKKGTLSMKNFSQCDHHPKEANEEAVNWLFVIDTLNFCFWTGTDLPKWEVTWKGKTYTGYFALCAAVNRALEEGYKITNPKYYSQITEKDLKRIFRGDNENVPCPLLQERLECLHQVGLVLLESYSGCFSNCIKKCNKSAQSLVSLVVDNFKCFRDEAVYESQKIAIYKRVQILVGDIWSCFGGEGLGKFDDIDTITMFADYRIPQVLVHFKAMKYTEELMEKLKADTILENGSPEEVEIRALSIEAVEQVKEEVAKLIPDAKPFPTGKADEIISNSILIDHFLWDYRRKYASELEVIPFHKTQSIYY